MALLAGLAAALVAIVFDLALAERVVDRAVRLESAAHGHVDLLPEPFSRRGQRGGLVLGQLLLGAGIGLLLAAAATFLGPRSRSPRRLWLLAVGASIWGVVVLPAAIYPPLPPGVEVDLPIGERQLLYLAVVAVGTAGFGAAARAGRRAVGLATALVPAALAIALFPRQHPVSPPPSLLLEFRVVSILSQLLFWATLGVVGAWLLGRRRG